MKPKTHLSNLVLWAGVALLVAALLLPASASSQTAPISPSGGRLVLLSKLDGPPLPAYLRILEDYNAFVMAEVSDAQLAALPQANIMDLMPDRTVISLNGTVWDTQQGEPAIPDNLRAAATDPYFLVQFYGPVKNEWVSELEQVGVTFLGYHPNYTYIVRMDPVLLPKVEAAHAVQWVGRYHPAYRLASAADLAKAQVQGGRIALEVRGFPRRGHRRAPGATESRPAPRSGSPSLAGRPSSVLGRAGAVASTGDAAGRLPGRGL